jgi:SAM-dependent methyltransferase
LTEVPDTGAPDAQTRAAYQRYFTSGTYDRRYPTPNRTMWRRIMAHLGPESAVLDYGCGSGRYLLKLRGKVARAIGFDVSPAALSMVRAHVGARGWDALSVIGPEAADLEAHLAEQGPVDVVLCLFGVVGHITDAGERCAALARMARALRPGGRLLISVPNRTRRFRAEQVAGQGAGQGDLVRYTRQIEGEAVPLSYQLFDAARLERELRAAGFSLRVVGCESVLPEDWLLRYGLARWIDGLLTPLCPVRWGYGIYAEATV